MSNFKVRLYQSAVAVAVAVAPFAAFAESAADPTTAAIASVSQAGVWGAAIGGAVLGVLAAIAAFKWVRKAL